MLDQHKITPSALNKLLQRGHSVRKVLEMTPEEAFEEWCEWHGLIGWGNRLVNALIMFREAEKKPNE